MATELHNFASWDPGKGKAGLLPGESRAGLEHLGFGGDVRHRLFTHSVVVPKSATLALPKWVKN